MIPSFVPRIYHPQEPRHSTFDKGHTNLSSTLNIYPIEAILHMPCELHRQFELI